MNRLLFAALLATVCFAQNNVPSQYQAIYSLINTQLTAFDATLRAGWDGTPFSYVTAPQLMTASSDQFTQLIGADYYSMAVEPELISLQALGVQGVTIHIDLPILYQPFYSSNPAQYQQFVQFYQQVVQDVHARGMKVVVETGVGSVLSGDLVNEYQAFYASLDWPGYMAARAVTCLNVAQLVQPDYLTVVTEPDSEAINSGQTNAGTVSGSTQLLQTIMTSLTAANVQNISVGAGAGSWTTDYVSYVQSFLLQPINFLDMHIYPVNRSFLQTALTGAQMAHAAGKQVAMSECWDWKIADDELGVLTYTTIEARNPFGFWSLDDQQFLQTMNDFAQADQFTFISPFWSHYFNAYLSWSQYGTLSESDLMSESYTATSAAMNAGRYSSTGKLLESIVLPAPDLSPPTTPAAPTLIIAGSTQIQINWGPDTDNVGVAGFYLLRNGVFYDALNAFTYYDSGLTPGATYTYALAAFDASGNISAVSPPLTVQTIDTTPPTAPGGLTITGVTNTSISLSWTASYGIDGIAGYTVLRGTSPTDLTYHATGITGVTYTDPYVYPNTTYYYEVQAYIADGLGSPPSNVVIGASLP